RGGLAACTTSCAPCAAAITLAASIASPFTHSIGLRGPSLAAAAAGSRVSALTRQPCLISASAACRPKSPVAPITRAVRIGAVRSVEVVIGVAPFGERQMRRLGLKRNCEKTCGQYTFSYGQLGSLPQPASGARRRQPLGGGAQAGADATDRRPPRRGA